MLKKFFNSLLAGLFFTGFVLAHDPGLSTLALALEDNELRAILTLSPQDLEALLIWQGEKESDVASRSFASRNPRLETLAQRAVEIRQQGQPLPLLSAEAGLDSVDNVTFLLRYPRPSPDSWSVHSVFLDLLPRGHRQYVSLQDAAGKILTDRVLDSKETDFKIDGSGSPLPDRAENFKQFFWLGVEHIVTGYDHLLFLLGLLILGSGLLAAGKMITAFTAAHSLTLLLAAFHWVEVPPSIVEPLIALSIVYVGLENLLRRSLERRWALAFGFGLIHGLGFASVLHELGVGASASGMLIPLMSFNLGVEAGQLAIAALALPLIWQWKKRPTFLPRYAPVCSLLVTLSGGYWLIERTLL